MKASSEILKKYAMIDIAHKLGYTIKKPIPYQQRLTLTIFYNKKQLTNSSLLFPILYISIWIQTGQKPIQVKAKKPMANFQIFEGDLLGLSVNLRKKKMFDFLDSFMNEGIPYIYEKNPDFRGFSSDAYSQTWTLAFPKFPLLSALSPLYGLSKKYSYPHTGIAINFSFSKSEYHKLWATATHFPIVL